VIDPTNRGTPTNPDRHMTRLGLRMIRPGRLTIRRGLPTTRRPDHRILRVRRGIDPSPS
jgi:hypothetical protein